MSTLSDASWIDLLRRAAAGDHVEVNGRSLPTAPNVQLQINTVGQSGPAAMDEAWAFAGECLARFRASPLFNDRHKTLLDFGTGWARIARCFLRDVTAENIIGVDVDPDLVAVCQANFNGPRFLCCDPMPPLILPDASVDFVVGYSVFSHLSETACRAWIAEFARLLKPGGMAALTTRGRWFFDYAARTPCPACSRILQRPRRVMTAANSCIQIVRA
jgi:SAM-dependent methyltransferase